MQTLETLSDLGQGFSLVPVAAHCNSIKAPRFRVRAFAIEYVGSVRRTFSETISVEGYGDAKRTAGKLANMRGFYERVTVLDPIDRKSSKREREARQAVNCYRINTRQRGLWYGEQPETAREFALASCDPMALQMTRILRDMIRDGAFNFDTDEA